MTSVAWALSESKLIASLLGGGPLVERRGFRGEQAVPVTGPEAGADQLGDGTPLVQRITHPGSGKYPDATFDYLFASNIISSKIQISPSHASDHYPVTCDFALAPTHAQSAQNMPAPDVPKSNSGTRNAPATTLPATTVSPAPQFATITQPVKIKIPYGETVLPRGLKLAVLSRNAQTVTVQYLDGTQIIPISSTDLR